MGGRGAIVAVEVAADGGAARGRISVTIERIWFGGEAAAVGAGGGG